MKKNMALLLALLLAATLSESSTIGQEVTNPKYVFSKAELLRNGELLKHAAHRNRLDYLKIIIKAGVHDINKPDEMGKTALDYAKANKNQAMIDVLYEAGATEEEERPKKEKLP